MSILELDAGTLRRLHAVFFPESPVPPEWCDRLALLLRESAADGVEVLAYLQAMRRHEDGLAGGHPAVTASLAAPIADLTHFDSRVTLLVHSTDAERRLEPLAEFYRELGLPVVFATDARTTAATRDLLAARGAAVVEIDDEGDPAALEKAIFAAVPTDWVVRLHDHELPTPALLGFVQRAVEFSPEFVWGFARVPCRYDDARDEVEYSQFLPFGPLGGDRLQWRLASRHEGPRQRRTAATGAILLDYAWVARPLAERIGDPSIHEQPPSPVLPGCLPESIPERWHMFAWLPGERYRDFARALWRSSGRSHVRIPDASGAEPEPVGAEQGAPAAADPHPEGLRAAARFLESSGTAEVAGLAGLTGEEVGAWRERIVGKAAEHMSRGDLPAAIEVLRMLEFATIDDRTLELTDPFLPRIADGRRVVASLDPDRRPRRDEVVIIYGNYPHTFANVVVNNPVRRHLADFWKFRHDHVESDPRWEGIDRIFVINADERLDRWDGMLRELASARAPLDRVTRVPACKPDPGEMNQVGRTVACLSSHLEALRRARAAKLGHVLVLEDDFTFTSDIDRHLTDLRIFVERGYDYWICLIATSKYGAVVPKDDLLCMTFQPCTNAGGYLVSAAGREQLIPVYENALERLRATGDTLSYAADRCWAVLQPSGRFLVFRRKFGFQGASFSDIEQAIARYLD